MAIGIHELMNSRDVDRTVDNITEPRRWIAYGSLDQNAIVAKLLTVAPIRADGLRRTRFNAKHQGGGVWMCEVEYGWSANSAGDDLDEQTDPNDDTELGPESSFDLTGGTAHITQGLNTRSRWKPGKTTDAAPNTGDALACGANASVTAFLFAPASTRLTLDGYAWDAAHLNKFLFVSGADFTPGVYQITAGAGATVTVGGRVAARAGVSGGSWVIDSTSAGSTGTAADLKSAIGVTRDGVEGTDVVVPKCEFTWTRQVKPVNLPYLRRIRSVVGKTNNARWRGFDKGELLYLGSTGQSGPGGVWTVAHKFAAGENLYAVRVTPTLVLPRKGAWDYLWCTYGYKDDTTVYSVPTAGYVEQVYREANFALLGLGF